MSDMAIFRQLHGSPVNHSEQSFDFCILGVIITGFRVQGFSGLFPSDFLSPESPRPQEKKRMLRKLVSVILVVCLFCMVSVAQTQSTNTSTPAPTAAAQNAAPQVRSQLSRDSGWKMALR